MPVFYGEYDDNGAIKRDTVVCAITGTIIEPGDAQMGIPGTKYFVRVKASVASYLGGNLKNQWDQVVANAPKSSAVVQDVFADEPPKKAKA